MKARRILHVSTTISHGGAENHLFELVQHQREAGMNVAVAYLRGGRRELNVPAHDLALRFYGDLRPLMRLRSLIAEFKPELVHAHMPPGELYARLALLDPRAWHMPLLITKHNEERFYRGLGQKLMGRWVGRRARYVIAISDAVKRFMTGPALGLDVGKFHTIRYGIDAGPFAAVPKADVASLRKQWRLADEDLAVGFVGRLVEQKDIEMLMRGFALFAAGFEKAKLVIVGIGPLEGLLRQRAEELGISSRVVWAGFRNDITVVMAAFDIFALTSVYEGLGLVLLEAMAAGRPVVATDVGAIPEVVSDGETGILVRNRAPDALASAFSTLTDPSLRERFGEAGLQRVLREFTLERMGDATDAVYAQCVEACGSRIEEEIPCVASTVN